MCVLFGYGSLILPPSLVARFSDITPGLDHVYEDDSVKPNVRSEALNKWQDLADRIKYIPAEVSGFRRYYSVESKHGGTMLEVVQTGEDCDTINGVLIHGLNESERQLIAETERGYNTISVPASDLNYYVDEEKLSVKVADMRVRIFVRDADINDISTKRKRNYTYHNRILRGIQMLGDMYGNDVASRFYEDFCTTTYETAYDSDDPLEFNTVRENDKIADNGSYINTKRI